MDPDKVTRPPKDDLFRSAPAQPALREDGADGEAGDPTMVGHFAVFDTWTEINSIWEGEFMESIAPGAFRKTMKENRDQIKVTLNHGRDPQFGDKPLGPITELSEDDEGAYYEVPLLDAPYVRQDFLPGLEAGLYGASFRFQVMKEEFDEEPPESDHNPTGMPERVIKEIRLFEFGPVTFPAYPEATAGMRSLTDEFRLPGVRELITQLGAGDGTGRIVLPTTAVRVTAGAAALTPEPVMATTPESRSTPSRDYLDPTWPRPLGHLDQE